MGPRDRAGERRRDPSAVVLRASLRNCTANPGIGVCQSGDIVAVGSRNAWSVPVPFAIRGPYDASTAPGGFVQRGTRSTGPNGSLTLRLSNFRTAALIRGFVPIVAFTRGS